MSAAAARRIAVAAQQLDGAKAPARIDRGTVRRTVERLGLLQIDSVNVLSRAHRLPLLARLGPYPVEFLEESVWTTRPQRRTLIETWAHEASMVPVDLHPMLRWERRHWSSKNAAGMRAKHPGLLENVLAVVTERGPSTAGQIEEVLTTGVKGKPGWWEWSQAKQACEALFSAGLLGTAYRRGFERHYDLLERVLPPSLLEVSVPDPAQAHRVLVERAARAHGIGTVKDLADYYRMSVAATTAAVTSLAADGILEPVQVPGWRSVAWVHAEARRPRTVQGSALLCPFDPLVWERQRTERLFGMRYRIEIYTPAPQREYGYYVFPLLAGDELVGRFDLKADRATGRLLVQASWLEPGADPATAATTAARELRRMADWLELPEIEVVERGNLHRETRAAVRVRAG
ncbi:winged helix-turn-helix domain-containing protein [Nakamurella sp. YIM 132087]|uniref:Winged helix-turn-helix domain-containing protein n=2 Tax=Nakamurella alba TaxID=2665158 RepID=A0A7K1FHY5_9ACTN|nr:winged helix-turn-helix domain-containing protein [Nakamurella alba]